MLEASNVATMEAPDITIFRDYHRNFFLVERDVDSSLTTRQNLVFEKCPLLIPGILESFVHLRGAVDQLEIEGDLLQAYMRLVYHAVLGNSPAVTQRITTQLASEAILRPKRQQDPMLTMALQHHHLPSMIMSASVSKLLESANGEAQEAGNIASVRHNYEQIIHAISTDDIPMHVDPQIPFAETASDVDELEHRF